MQWLDAVLQCRRQADQDQMAKPFNGCDNFHSFLLLSIFYHILKLLRQILRLVRPMRK